MTAPTRARSEGPARPHPARSAGSASRPSSMESCPRRRELAVLGYAFIQLYSFCATCPHPIAAFLRSAAHLLGLSRVPSAAPTVAASFSAVTCSIHFIASRCYLWPVTHWKCSERHLSRPSSCRHEHAAPGRHGRCSRIQAFCNLPGIHTRFSHTSTLLFGSCALAKQPRPARCTVRCSRAADFAGAGQSRRDRRSQHGCVHPAPRYHLHRFRPPLLTPADPTASGCCRSFGPPWQAAQGCCMHWKAASGSTRMRRATSVPTCSGPRGGVYSGRPAPTRVSRAPRPCLPASKPAASLASCPKPSVPPCGWQLLPAVMRPAAESDSQQAFRCRLHAAPLPFPCSGCARGLCGGQQSAAHLFRAASHSPEVPPAGQQGGLGGPRQGRDGGPSALLAA